MAQDSVKGSGVTPAAWNSPLGGALAAGTVRLVDPTLVKGLRILGLPGREARLYLSLVQSGPRGVREAAEGARLNRATAYRVLLRLLSRGLVIGDGRTPQTFHALSIDLALRRLGSFLHEEEELNTWLAEYCLRAARPVSSLESSGPGTEDFRLLTPREGTEHPALAELSEARHTIEAAFRPLSAGVSFRSGLIRVLGKSARAGVRVRVLLEAGPSDRRYGDRLLREAGGMSPSLEVRHYSPMAAHFYVIDSRRMIRFVTLGSLGRGSEIALFTETPPKVRTQLGRFEGMWGEATAVSASQFSSTRRSVWRPSDNATVSEAPNRTPLPNGLLTRVRPSDGTDAGPSRIPIRSS
jgi:Sugar-specific transcriptional regulator TrmB